MKTSLFISESVEIFAGSIGIFTLLMRDDYDNIVPPAWNHVTLRVRIKKLPCFPPIDCFSKASAWVVKDVCVLATLLGQCATHVGQICMELIVVCSLGLVSSATAKEGVFQIHRIVSVKDNFQVQLALHVPPNFSVPIVPDIAILIRLVMEKEYVTQMDSVS